MVLVKSTKILIKQLLYFCINLSHSLNLASCATFYSFSSSGSIPVSSVHCEVVLSKELNGLGPGPYYAVK
jgi:IS4 transposase